MIKIRDLMILSFPLRTFLSNLTTRTAHLQSSPLLGAKKLILTKSQISDGLIDK